MREGTVEVRFVRDEGFLGSALWTTVLVDGEAIADVDEAEILRLWVKPGVHVFAALPKPNLNLENPQELEIDVRLGRRVLIRLGYRTDGSLFVPTSF